MGICVLKSHKSDMFQHLGLYPLWVFVYWNVKVYDSMLGGYYILYGYLCIEIYTKGIREIKIISFMGICVLKFNRWYATREGVYILYGYLCIEMLENYNRTELTISFMGICVLKSSHSVIYQHNIYPLWVFVYWN